jgi:hypothetical protein
MRELEELVPQFEAVMAERDRDQGRSAALERDLAEATSQRRQLQADLHRAQEVPTHLVSPSSTHVLGLGACSGAKGWALWSMHGPALEHGI